MKILVLFAVFIVINADDIGGSWSTQSTKYDSRGTNIAYRGYGEQYYNQYRNRQDIKGNRNNQYDNKDYSGEKPNNVKDRYDAQLYDKYESPKQYILSYNNRNGYLNYDQEIIPGVYGRRKCDGKSKDCVESDDEDSYVEDRKRENINDYNDKNWYDNENINLVGLGQNDTEDIVRPCAMEDWQCIRQFLAQNSKCKPAFGPIPDPLYLRRNTVYFPNINVTVIITRHKIEGLSNIKISEFYVNRDTGNLVLALNFRKMKQTSPKTYFRFQRRAKESIVGSDFAAVEFDSGTFTAVIPKIPNLRLDLAEVHADLDNPRPPLIFGPGAVNSTDPAVASALAKVLIDLPTAVQEGFLFQSQLFTAIYIQEYLCDFGLKLISI